MSTVYNVEIRFRESEYSSEIECVQFMFDSLEHNVNSEERAKSRAENILESLKCRAEVTEIIVQESNWRY